MTDVARPQTKTRHIESGIVLPKTVTSLTGRNIIASSVTMPSRERNVIIALDEILPPTAPPTMRPIIIANQ